MRRHTVGVDECKVLITPDGLGRIAVVRRPDGLFCLYQHWLWSAATQEAMQVQLVRDRRWTDPYDRAALYADAEPLPGLFGTIDEAEREARGRRGFAEAVEERR